MGAILDARRLPEKWVKPIDDKIESAILGFHDSRISDLAKRTYLLAKSNTDRFIQDGH